MPSISRRSRSRYVEAFAEHFGYDMMVEERRMIARRHPEWIRARAPTGAAVAQTRAIVREHRLHTVCEEAQCPNLGECWAHDTATFMLLGDTCTRNCQFCAVSHGRPLAVDPDEPRRVAEAVARLGLRHVVVTSVNRDDLADGGAATSPRRRGSCVRGFRSARSRC